MYVTTYIYIRLCESGEEYRISPTKSSPVSLVEVWQGLSEKGETVAFFFVNLWFLTCCHKQAFCSLKGKSNKVYKEGTYLLNGGCSKRKVEWKRREVVGAVSIGKEGWVTADFFPLCARLAWGLLEGIFLPFAQCKRKQWNQFMYLSLAWKLFLAWGGPCSPVQPHLPPDPYW